MEESKRAFFYSQNINEIRTLWMEWKTDCCFKSPTLGDFY